MDTYLARTAPQFHTQFIEGRKVFVQIPVNPFGVPTTDRYEIGSHMQQTTEPDGTGYAYFDLVGRKTRAGDPALLTYDEILKLNEPEVPVFRAAKHGDKWVAFSKNQAAFDVTKVIYDERKRMQTAAPRGLSVEYY